MSVIITWAGISFWYLELAAWQITVPARIGANVRTDTWLERSILYFLTLNKNNYYYNDYNDEKKIYWSADNNYYCTVF